MYTRVRKEFSQVSQSYGCSTAGLWWWGADRRELELDVNCTIATRTVHETNREKRCTTFIPYPAPLEFSVLPQLYCAHAYNEDSSILKQLRVNVVEWRPSHPFGCEARSPCHSQRDGARTAQREYPKQHTNYEVPVY